MLYGLSSAQTNLNCDTIYFPLQVGNTWNFKYTEADSIFALPYKIFDTTLINDTLYFKYGDVAEYPFLIRADSLGRIVRRVDNKEEVWFDFTKEDNSRYEYKFYTDCQPYSVVVKRNISIMTYMGLFENCIEFFFDDTTSFDDEQWYTFAPKIGIVRMQYAWVNILLASARIDGSIITSVDSNLSHPVDCLLEQNFPNPFNAETKIRYVVKFTGLIVLKIYNVGGREIGTLVNEIQSPGDYELLFDGSNLPSGLYFYTLANGDMKQVKKFNIIR